MAITAMVCASEGDLCYHLHNAARPMTDPRNNEDQELNLDQLKDAAGGIVHPQYRDRLGGAGDKLKDVIITSVNDGSSELDKSSSKYNPGKGASINRKGDGYTEVEWT
ncbi:hypothetical protein [Synechococcus sp. RS9916]|uniref:hypothetical protein n=1 Tax=Synechococcus sp. RS9916 TaxID=221359 RepID=UPI0018DC746B|nr:hypothetical protein [Synechococcus sp. RS9916]